LSKIDLKKPRQPAFPLFTTASPVWRAFWPVWQSLSAAHGMAQGGYTICCGKTDSRKKKASRT